MGFVVFGLGKYKVQKELVISRRVFLVVSGTKGTIVCRDYSVLCIYRKFSSGLETGKKKLEPQWCSLPRHGGCAFVARLARDDPHAGTHVEVE